MADNGREGARPWPSAPHARRVGSYEIFVDIQVDQNRSKLLYNCCSMTYSVMLAVWQCQLKGNKNLHIYIYILYIYQIHLPSFTHDCPMFSKQPDLLLNVWGGRTTHLDLHHKTTGTDLHNLVEMSKDNLWDSFGQLHLKIQPGKPMHPS